MSTKISTAKIRRCARALKEEKGYATVEDMAQRLNLSESNLGIVIDRVHGLRAEIDLINEGSKPPPAEFVPYRIESQIIPWLESMIRLRRLEFYMNISRSGF